MGYVIISHYNLLVASSSDGELKKKEWEEVKASSLLSQVYVKPIVWA